MKTKYLVLSIATMFMFQITNAQKLEQDQVETLTQVLNTTVAPKFRVELKSNTADCSIDELSNILDLRDNYDIAEDSITKEAKAKLQKGDYGGPVFWKHNFQTTTNSEVLFIATKIRQLFCKISFQAQDTIVLNSQLNAYTSQHKTSDTALHEVHWTGDKYISLTLVPKWVNNTIKFDLRGITLSGKFQRPDAEVISKKYSKSLRTILKREFKTLFESEEMTLLVSQKFKN
jgi:hypothetical protein